MDFYKLDPTTYIPVKLIEGYSSLIWTERYSVLGGFEMRSPLIEEHMADLPEETLVSHKETQEVFIVDTLFIETTEDGARELVVSGVSFESVLQDRVAEGVYQQPWRVPVSYNGMKACGLLIYNYLCNPHGKDLTKETVHEMSGNNLIPNLGVATQDTTNEVSTMPVFEWWMETGEVYPIFTDWLSRQNLGVRNVRPVSEFENRRMALMEPCYYTSASGYVPEALGTKLRMMVYKGLDRSRGQNRLPKVTFQYDEGDLADPKYLFSTRGLKNVCVVNSSMGSITVYADNNVSPFLTGRQRRVMTVDAGDVGDQDPTAFHWAMVQKGQIELAKYNRQQLFDAEIAETTPYKYKTHYDLGDRVSLHGEFGFKPKMMVNEYVRIEDEEGDRGFPTLVLAT